jgi:uncharacterized protein YdcH (DUF465 family)
MSFVRVGFGDEALAAQIFRYQQALHQIITAIQMAERTGQQAAADQLRVQMLALTDEINTLVRQQREQDNPSAFGIKLAPDERLVQAQRDVKQAARDIAEARAKGSPQALAYAKQSFTRAASTYTAQVAQTKARETPSGFSLGLADLGAMFQKYLPWVAGAAVVALVLPSVLARRRA